MRRLLILPLLCILLAGLASGQVPSPVKPILVLDADGHTDVVRKVLFTPSSKFAITVSYDKSVRIWDLTSGESTRTMRLASGSVDEGLPFAAASSSTGYIAVGGYPLGKGKLGVPITLINPRTAKVDKVFKGHEFVITALAFSKDGKLLASGSGDETVRVWDVKTGKAQVFEGHGTRIRDLAWSPDGKRLISVAGTGTGRIWSLASGKTDVALTSKERPLLTVAWSPDGKTIATGSADSTITLWDPTGKQLKVIPNLQAKTITSLAFSPNSKELLCTGLGQTDKDFPASVIDVASGQERLRIPFHTNLVVHGSFSPDGKLAATTGGTDNETFIWNVADGKLVHTLAGKGKTPWSVAWSPDGKSIAWGTNKQSAQDKLERSFNLEDLEFGSTPSDQYARNVVTQDGWSLELNAQQQVLAKQGDKIIHTLQTDIPKEPIYSFTWLKDGRAVLGGAVCMWLVDAKANRVIRELTGHTSRIYSVAPSPDGKLIASSANDMTIRIWDPEKPEPLLTFFFADNEWVGWTPEGYFAASAGGEQLMGWQFNQGADQLASYAPAARFRQSLYMPDVIQKVVAERSVAKALLAAGKKPGDLVNVARALPPQVTITAPTAPAQGPLTVAEGKPLEIQASAKSTTNYAITSMRLMIDGRPYKGQESVKRYTPAKSTVAESWKLELPPGTYSIGVQAQTLTSKGVSPLFEVNVGGKEVGPPNLYVLAVGISDYPGSLRLRYAATDADLITTALKSHCTKVFGKVETKVIKDKQATKAEIVKGMAWLKSVMTPRDVGVVSFSGHGGQDKTGNMFLIPVDGNPVAMSSSCVSGDWLKNALGDTPGRLIAILDACHSGSVAEGGGKRKALFDDLVRDLISDDYGVIVMCSSLGREYSLEGSDVKAGYFTIALCEGLAGKADFNKDGEIFLNELEGYAARRVKQLTGGTQNPTTAKPPNVAWFPLVRN